LTLKPLNFRDRICIMCLYNNNVDIPYSYFGREEEMLKGFKTPQLLREKTTTLLTIKSSVKNKFWIMIK